MEGYVRFHVTSARVLLARTPLHACKGNWEMYRCLKNQETHEELILYAFSNNMLKLFLSNFQTPCHVCGHGPEKG